jgi:RNA polymerase sigma-70 factor (ECF subfamily)
MAPGSQTSDIQLAELVKQASEGNRFAFEQLIDHHQGDIYRMIYYRIRARMDAEDLTQDVVSQHFPPAGAGPIPQLAV